MLNLKVEELHGNAALTALRTEWQELYRAAEAVPFLSWEWLATWQEQLGAGREPLLLCVRDGQRLIGLLPLTVEERRLTNWFGKFRRIAFMGEAFAGTDYLDVLALPAQREAICRAAFEYLFNHVQFELLELEGMAADSPNLPLLEQMLAQRFGQRARFTLRRTTQYTCPQVELNSDWETLLANTRRGDNFKQKLRRMRQRHAFEYRVVTALAEVEAAFERYYQLHEKRWQQHGGSDATGHPRLREFQAAAVERLAETGLVRFEEIWLDGVCCASNYALDDGQNFYFYSAGYDQTHRNLSPGLVLTGLSIENAIQRGLKRFDFLRGDEGYKFDWSNAARETLTITLARRTVAATLHLARQQAWERVRDVIKTALPAPVAATLRNWLRLARRQQSFAPDNV